MLSPSENTLKRLLQRARLVSQSPTDVCVKCYNGASPFYNTRWLTWLECAKHPEHEGEMGVMLIVGHDHEVVEVLELPRSLSGCSPHELSLCEKMKQPRGCPDEVNCKNAHTIEELEYWKWSLIHKVLEKVYTPFVGCILLKVINSTLYVGSQLQCPQREVQLHAQ